MPTQYQPDDAKLTLASLEFLRTPAGISLRRAVAALVNPAHPTVSEVATLRKSFPTEAVHAALALGKIQPKAREKFPEVPYLWSPPEALEQASGSIVARHKASRFAAALTPGRTIVDLCAGIGGDTLALANVGPVTAVELSPLRAACLGYNAADQMPPPQFAIDIRETDAQTLLPTLLRDILVHIDPARRTAGIRSLRFEDMAPGPEFVAAVMAHAAGVGIKLSSAVDFDSIPRGHLELISHHGVVVQAMLWTGALAFAGNEKRTATVLPPDGTTPFSFTGTPTLPSTNPLPIGIGTRPTGPPTYLYELDGTLTRSGLAAPFAAKNNLTLATLDGGYAWSSSVELNSHPALTGFTLLGLFPYNESKIAAELATLAAPTQHQGPSVVEVKCRGHLPGVETDHLQVAWTRAASAGCTVLIFRHEKETLAAIATRIARD